jgi:hypothetical protein
MKKYEYSINSLTKENFIIFKDIFKIVIKNKVFNSRIDLISNIIYYKKHKYDTFQVAIFIDSLLKLEIIKKDYDIDYFYKIIINEPYYDITYEEIKYIINNDIDYKNYLLGKKIKQIINRIESNIE